MLGRFLNKTHTMMEKMVSDTTLDDLNNDPSLLESLSPDDIKRLQNEAELGEVPLGGNIRSTLNSLYNENFPSEE